MLGLLIILIAVALIAALAASPFIPGPPDAALELQAAVTKTASFNGAGLDLGENFNPGGLGLPVAGVVQIAAADFTTGDETYDFVLEQSDDDGDADAYAPIGLAESVVTNGETPAAYDAQIVVTKGFLTKRYCRLKLTVDGETPSVTYSANLNPVT